VSDLLGPYVGQTEQNIAEAFRTAEEQKAILFFDEADSFLRKREQAHNSWEVTQVNELLTRMENFTGIFIAATNHPDTLDAASLRRFALKLGFDFLNAKGIRIFWNIFFPWATMPTEKNQLSLLTPGDFHAVLARVQYLEQSSLPGERLYQELMVEVAAKDTRAGRRLGF